MIAPLRRALIALSTTSALFAACAASPVAAQADGGCPGADLSQPFAPWGDLSSYELVPGGDFETSAWTLRHGAQPVGGSEPYAVTGTLGATSLLLPPGASATSPSTCVDVSHPTLRFFIGGTGTVLVQVIYANKAVPVGIATAGGGWGPSPIMLTGSAVFGGLVGTAEMSLRFTQLSGSPQIDDVFIDPWNRG
jgi:hypothetical protein